MSIGVGSNSIRDAVSLANSTSTALNNSEVFTGTWEEARFDSLTVALAADQDCTYQVQFSPDGTNVDSTLTYNFEAGVVEVPKRLVISRRFFRVVITNDSGSNMTYLRCQVREGSFDVFSTAINGIVSQDHDAIVTRSLPYEDEVSLDKYIGRKLYNKFGRNLDIDTAGNEDVWNGGGDYTGFPTGSPENLQIVLSDAGDIGGKITLRYLATSASTEWVETTITTTGANTDTGISAYRCTSATWDGTDASTPGINAGTVIVRHITTTANVFINIPIGFGRSLIGCETIPAGNTAVIKKLNVTMLRSNSANCTGALWIRPFGKTEYYIRPLSITQNDAHTDEIWGGIPIEGGCDIAVKILTCSANNVTVYANFDYILVKD